ncbi:MAG TPA: non-homologous end-joining DNA ligase [Actinomycetota bacterium]|jgi:DNA ligase D-like protein (predicted ligase)/DNA ligase D-like protein (predicted polymerase)/DNA ligase D-like protein (predicted 3'-phosphoesterase)|nr:non-homologous end-joining DNA ligase [Actinomycetota bacterium]
MPARRKGPAFTVELPRPLEARRDGDAWWFEVDGRELRLSNLDKVFWPDEGYTKGDLVAYYFNVAELIVPHLSERPLTMKRMPDGITGPFFYEKSAPSHVPDWIGRCPVESEDSKKGVIDYMTIDDTAGLLFVANLGCIEFHPLHSRCADVEHPDYLFFDLDPFPPYTYEDVLVVARHIKVLLDQLGLSSYPKTSGATGLQIYLPLERGVYTYDQARAFVGACGRLILGADPDRVTMAWKIADRTGKIFIDHNMNRSGANIAAAYCLRPEPRAPVSTPLGWDEVFDGGFEPQDFRIDNVWERFARVGDLFEGVRTEGMDLSNALEALDVKVEEAEPLPSTVSPKARARTSEEVAAASKDPKLLEYVRKRDFEGTPEPAPGAAGGAGNSFVIQKHRATRLHYDVRLERDGAMPSWAVPKGLPTVKGEKRLAVRTEDHPLEYASFEGMIPEGHYGAGEVRIFDSGWYEPIEWDDKKVSFKLHGRRYPGLEFHFVKTRTDWLAFLASAQSAALIESPPRYQPMLAEGGWKAFDDHAWWFEPKMDGIRCLAYLNTGETQLLTRNGRDVTGQYPDVHMIHELVDQVNAVIDGEIVAFDKDGKNSFEALQQRMNLQNEREIKRAAAAIPVSIVGFDLLWLDGRETTGLTIEERRELMTLIVEPDHRLQLMTHVEGEGTRFAEAARALGLEGVVAKKKGSKYLPGKRSDAWRKIKLINTQDCVILGWTPGQRGRSATFGALLVGAYVDGSLVWIGQVGTGFTDKMLERVIELLEPLERATPPIDDPELARHPEYTWFEPEIVCEVEYLEITKSTHKMRAPSFKGLRPDKTPDECVLETPPKAASRAKKG